MEGLPLSSEAKAAIVERKGELGGLLEAVVGCERGQWDAVERNLGVDAPVRDCFVDAVAWAAEVQSSLNPT